MSVRRSTEYDDLIRDLIENDPDHYHLNQAGVTVAVLVHSGNTLKLHGYECAATVSRTPVKQRELGTEDAVITLDASFIAETFNSGKLDEFRAVLDHELYHLSPDVDKWEYQMNPDGTHATDTDGNWIKLKCSYKYDHANRPKLSMRMHDVQMGHFTRMIEKHGKKSAEARQIKFLTDHLGNLLFGFAATETEITETRTRYNWRKDRVPSEFHHAYDEDLAKRDRKMVRSQKTAAAAPTVEEEA